MMNKSVLFLSLLSGTTLLPGLVLASGFPTHTLTNTPEPEPVSFVDMAHSYKTAAVCFLGYGDCDPDTGFGSGNADYAIDTTIQCRNEGFSRQNCNSVQVIDGVCPYNSSFGKGCKCADGLVSCSEGQTGVGESCGGKYAKCECVTGVSAGAYGCKEYYPSPCSSVCKTAYTDNCRNREDNNSAVYGCMKYWSDCPSKCETPYTDNCRNRTAVSCEKGCATYFADCSSKCSVCKTDNCANRTAVSIPANASCSSYYDDCDSKCSAWSCKTGYQNSSGRCILQLPILYGDGTVSYEPTRLSGKTPIGIVLDTNSRLAMALTDVKKDGSPGSEKITFSEKAANIDIKDYRSWFRGDNCEQSSKESTKIILANKNLGSAYAALAANSHEPPGCAGNFCRKGNWFLPNICDLDSYLYYYNGALNVSLQIAGGTELNFRLYSSPVGYWSSTEKDTDSMWYYGSSPLYGGKEWGTHYVRPIVTY